MPPLTPDVLHRNDLVIDTWSGLGHKAPLSTDPRAAVGRTWIAPTWTGIHARRLAAYKILQAYLSNIAREFMVLPYPGAVTGNAAATQLLFDRSKHVEFGDPAALRNAVVGTLLGDEQQILVEGADEDLPELPDESPTLPGVATPPEPDPDPAADTGAGLLAAIEAERARITAARDRQEWLREWVDDEHVVRKIFEGERNAVGLGDGVYVMRWSSRKKRPTVRVYDPGFYFPVLSRSDDEEYPTTVHVAWEEEERVDGVTTKWVRRQTWRLGDIGKPADTGLIAVIRNAVTGTHEVEVPNGASIDPGSGKIVRKLPWNDAPTSVTCYLTDARWRLQDVGARHVSDLDEKSAVYETNEDGEDIRDLDLEIDFIPVVHVPNTVAEEEHYGTSALMLVAQILDELAAADTDLASAAATTGTPPLALSGGVVGQNKAYRAGGVWELPVGGRLDVVDTSKSLDALMQYVDALLKRLSTNARVPASVLGRIDPSEIASGVLLALSFGPLKQLITEMRLVRDEKYPLMLKFAQRLAIAGGELDGEPLRAHLEFGSFMPHDRAEAVKLVRELLGSATTPAAVSRMTALRMLVDAGFDLGDAVEELERIEAEDFVGAKELLDATGDEGAVFDYLGRAPTPGSLVTRPTLAPDAPAAAGGGFTPQLPAQPGTPPRPAPPQGTPPPPQGTPPAQPA